MPMIDLTLPEGALPDDAKGRLVEELTTALLKWEGAPDNEVARSIAWTYVDERPAGAINVAGAPAQEPVFARTPRASIGSPHSEHTHSVSVSWPQARCSSLCGAPASSAT